MIAFIWALLLTAAAQAQTLPATSLTGPSNAATGVSLTPTFTYTAVSGANRYWVMVATSASAFPTDPNAVSCPICVSTGLSGNTGATSYTPPTPFPYGGTTRILAPNTTYYWKVQAWNTNGAQGAYSVTRSFTTGSGLLPPPILSGPSNGATNVSTTPQFSWSTSQGANRYWLMVATSASAFPTDPNAVSCPVCVSTGLSGNTGATSYTPPIAFPYGGTTRILAPNTTYYWKVQSWNTNGAQGEYSAVRSFTTAPLPCNYAISPSSASFSSGGGSGSFNVTTTSGCTWSASDNASWISVSSGSGNGNGSVSFSVTSNSSSSSRSGQITVQGQTFTVNQQGVSILAPPILNGPGGSGVSTTPTFSWSTVPGANRYWLMVATSQSALPTDPNAVSCPGCINTGLSGLTSSTSYTPPTAFPFGGTTRILSPNTTYYWQVQGYNTDGTQGQYSSVWSFTTGSSCTYVLNPASAPAPAAASSGSFLVSVAAGCPWTAASNASWLTVTSGQSGSGAGSVTYAAAANPSASPRTGTITVAGQAFLVSQAGGAPILGEPAHLGVVWIPSPNFGNRPANQVIDTIVIHTLEDDYAGGIQDLTNPMSQKSAHYVISETGVIAQLVQISKRAWHANYYNDRSIGIEMAGFAGNAGTWTPQNLNALESLVAYLVVEYDIPIVHPSGDASMYPNCLYTEIGLVGHYQLQPGESCNGYDYRSDPGPHFPWTSFVQHVQNLAGTDLASPQIHLFQVNPDSINLGDDFTITYAVTDAGGSGLDRIELWRANVDGSTSDPTWEQIDVDNASGNGPLSGGFADEPDAAGEYWYGIHVVDNAGNLIDERMAGLGPIHVSVISVPLDCIADVTNDNVVNVNDLLEVIGAWGGCSGCLADVNGNGTVSVDDLLLVVNAWGPCP